MYCRWLARTADMVVVMVGQQDRPQLQLARGQCLFHRSIVAGIDDERVARVIVQQPDVIVGQCR